MFFLHFRRNKVEQESPPAGKCKRRTARGISYPEGYPIPEWMGGVPHPWSGGNPILGPGVPPGMVDRLKT